MHKHTIGNGSRRAPMERLSVFANGQTMNADNPIKGTMHPGAVAPEPTHEGFFMLGHDNVPCTVCDGDGQLDIGNPPPPGGEIHAVVNPSV